MDLLYNIPGLKNIDGTSCYVNAVIQALTSLHPLTQELLKLKPTKDQQITTELWNIITEITSGQDRYISPTRIAEQIKRQSSGRFSNGRETNS